MSTTCLLLSLPACLFVCFFFPLLTSLLTLFVVCAIFSSLQVLKKEIAAIKIGEIAGWQKCLLFELTYTFFKKFESFKSNFSKAIRLMGLKVWYGLLIRDFISLASSKNDSHMLMKQKCKQRFAYSFFVF